MIKLINDLIVAKQFPITAEEQRDFVLYSAIPETFETYKRAKIYFTIVRGFCTTIGCTLAPTTNLWFDKSDFSCKMVITIKGFKGKMGKAIEANIAAVLADNAQVDEIKDLI